MTTIVLRKTTTKPANVEWWFKVEPTKAATMNQFMTDYPGVTLSYSTTVDENNIVTFIEFDSHESFGKYMVDLHALPEWGARATYIKGHGITETMSITSTD